MRNISFHADAWQDYLDWYQTNKSTFKKINALIRDAQRHPFEEVVPILVEIVEAPM